MKKLTCYVIIILISISVYSTTLIVDQFNGPYFTINDAYNDAVDEDIILIYPATYLESISISKAITLEGIDPNTTIIQSNSSYSIQINNSDVTVSNLKIVCSSNEGIEVYQSTPKIIHCIIENCDNGIYVVEDNVNIMNCLIKNCNNGLYFYKSTGGIAINNVIHDCSTGVTIYYNYSYTCSVDFLSNLILNCTYGITRALGSYTGDIAYNCFFNNTTNTNNVNLGPGNIFDIDPLLTDLTSGNYYLQENSPCIDTGIPGELYEDLDGTRNDMGIFGGPDQWGLGSPTVLDIQITPESVFPGETFDLEATGQIK